MQFLKQRRLPHLRHHAAELGQVAGDVLRVQSVDAENLAVEQPAGLALFRLGAGIAPELFHPGIQLGRQAGHRPVYPHGQTRGYRMHEKIVQIWLS